MQLSSSILSIALLVSSTMALPNGAIVPGPSPECPVSPYLYNCGTPSAPKCRTLQEYESGCGATPTACTFRHGPTPLNARNPGPACVVPPYLYGCGTSLEPRCCTLEEYEKLHPTSSTTSPTATTSSSTASATATLPNFGPGLACVVPPFLYGCGTGLHPRCCTLGEYIEKFGHLPPGVNYN